jgi:DNA end-binding protein Ku
LTGEFDPAQSQDEYRTALMQIIESKVEGKEIIAAPEPEEGSNLVDLMAALEASVKAAKAAREAGTPPPVSVAEAKAKKAEKGAAASKAKPAARAKAKADDEDEAEEAKPARRRKSA